MLPVAHWPVRVQGIEEDTTSNMLSFINFEPLELYWTYLLTLQTTTPKIPLMGLMSLDHEPKMRCCAMNSNYGPWWDYIVMSFGPWALASFLWIWTLLGFKIDSPKIHDNVDVVRVTNEMKPCGVKNLSSTLVLWLLGIFYVSSLKPTFELVSNSLWFLTAYNIQYGIEFLEHSIRCAKCQIFGIWYIWHLAHQTLQFKVHKVF